MNLGNNIEIMKVEFLYSFYFFFGIFGIKFQEIIFQEMMMIILIIDIDEIVMIEKMNLIILEVDIFKYIFFSKTYLLGYTNNNFYSNRNFSYQFYNRYQDENNLCKCVKYLIFV